MGHLAEQQTDAPLYEKEVPRRARLTTPLGAHGPEVAAGLRKRLHQLAAWTPRKLLFDPTVSAYRQHWQLAQATDLILCADTRAWPTYEHVRDRLTDLAQTADQLERALVDIIQQHQGLQYRAVRERI